jgi:hypothetical protein
MGARILPQANLRTPDCAKHKENRRSFSHSETMRTRTYSYLRRLRTSKPSRTRGLPTSADKCPLALVYRRDPLPGEWSATPQSLFPGAPCERSRRAANVTRAEQQRASLTDSTSWPICRSGREGGWFSALTPTMGFCSVREISRFRVARVRQRALTFSIRTDD